MNCAEEGYRVSVTEEGIDIAGFGANGLLYGVITLEQLLLRDSAGLHLPLLTVTDWPDYRCRGIKQECRYGSDMMERADWMAMLDDLAARKMNTLCLAIYGCWNVQYDGRVSEYIYLPIKGHPELRTPKIIKYWSPAEARWIECEQLPPIFRDNLMEDIFRRARDLGIQIIPGWNSYGHNTLLPAQIPEVSSRDESGEPSLVGFCTSNPATYELLFSIYDQIIDDYMIPYGMDSFNILLDEVHASSGSNAADVFKVRDPWCSCPLCRNRDKGEIYIEHAIKLISHLKSRGVKNVLMACDMLQPRGQRGLDLGWLGGRLLDAVKKEGLEDTLLLIWWSYHDCVDNSRVESMHPELGLRGICMPWNGYHHWCLMLNPLKNARDMAELNRRDGGEGMFAYSMWDRGADRTHDALAEYTWGFEQAGEPREVTLRYVLRHFAPRAREAFRACRLMDWCTEERSNTKFSIPDADHISNWDLLLYRLSSYFHVGVKKDAPYPRAFLDEALEFLLTMRHDAERALYSISAMAREAGKIFLDLAADSRCDREMAMRLSYECGNYQVLSEDWLAILEMYDLTQNGEMNSVIPIARGRQQARLELMVFCERAKEKFMVRSLTMRIHSIFMQMFADIADYVESGAEPRLDLLQMRNVLSDTSWWLR
ncbi:MAG: hypothetical protein GX907_04650 [Clostridiaceae bacterium]|nr:hypothetical protein [Clostridiaceae bacterium]